MGNHNRDRAFSCGRVPNMGCIRWTREESTVARKRGFAMVEIHDGNCLFVRFNWDHTAIPYAIKHPWITFKDIHLSPSPEFPTGRKGLALDSYWIQQQIRLNPAYGIFIIDGDVIVDPVDMEVMLDSIRSDPKIVHTAPVRLWLNTMRGPEWRWSHQNDNGLTQDWIDHPRYFSFCCTFLPASLMDMAGHAGLRQRVYPYVDEFVSDVAAQVGIPVNVVADAAPKHLPGSIW